MSVPSMRGGTITVWILLLSVVVGAQTKNSRTAEYLEDFEFIVKTVTERGAAVKSKDIDWSAISKAAKPRFATAADDVEHLRNIMRLLATLRDSHTGLTDSKIGFDKLPGRRNGLFGGGVWFGHDHGKFVLRGVMQGHPNEKELAVGSLLLSIDGVPSFIVMDRERARIAEFEGISTDHSLFAALGNTLLPFGEKQTLDVEFLVPDGKTRKVTLPRWGPRGRAFYPTEVQLPAGIVHAEGAVSGRIEIDGIRSSGYLRITGSMNDATVTAFHSAADVVADVAAMLLDCRFMGGGSDASAWNMAGRFFENGVDNGRHGRIEASGTRQFTGPVVLLQDETMVSSAETFTWAMTETGRVISIGRPTGGWGIIPNGFQLPSGLGSFRLGVNDRPTPIRGIHTEGKGWAPDVLIPFGPEVSAIGDADRKIGEWVLASCAAGISVDEVRSAFAGLSQGDLSRFGSFVKKHGAKVKGLAQAKLDDLFQRDLRGELLLETELLGRDGPVDVLRAKERIPSLVARAKGSGLAKEAAALEKKIASLDAEAKAQAAWLEMNAAKVSVPLSAEWKAFVQKHGKTRLFKWLEREAKP